jgi:hypothetical protein
MLTSRLHTRWITRFFVLLYLLLSFSTANAAFWCQGEQDSPHLESSPIGKCWTNCSSEDASLLQDKAHSGVPLFWSAPEDECLDSPVYSSVLPSSVRTNSATRIAAIDFDSVHIPFITTSGSAATHFGFQKPPFQLPATQTLAALRTVVLLH